MVRIRIMLLLLVALVPGCGDSPTAPAGVLKGYWRGGFTPDSQHWSIDITHIDGTAFSGEGRSPFVSGGFGTEYAGRYTHPDISMEVVEDYLFGIVRCGYRARLADDTNSMSGTMTCDNDYEAEVVFCRDDVRDPGSGPCDWPAQRLPAS